MPKILFCGDPHSEFGQIISAAHAHRPDAVVLLGDIEATRPLDIELAAIRDLTEIWWIHGNHDTDTPQPYAFLFDSALGDRNLHGRVVDIAGVRIAGLGGIFRGKIWAPEKGQALYESPQQYLAECGKENYWRDGLPLRHRSSIFPSEVQALSAREADILVTHEGPDLHPYGSPALTALAVKMNVAAAFHGHHHEDIAYPGGVWRGVGLRQVYLWSR
ncbi:metallophosphoesterase [Oxalobacteraceae bacterium CAVE-383]|nr:metallophosphoesterase [Oxalobacteraceae bacterium CAVE-383]